MTRLKTLREAGGLTQGQIAKKVGVSQPHYHRWETGETRVPDGHLAKLAKVLKTKPEAIAGPRVSWSPSRSKAIVKSITA